MRPQASEYLAARGLTETVPENLNEALRTVLETMEPMVYDDGAGALTAQEQAVLTEAGFDLERSPPPDALAKTAVKFAAILTRSLSSNAVSEKLGLGSSRIRQMIGDRSLYSVLIDGNRYIPDFQFIGKKMVPNIAVVNRALHAEMHPVEVFNWYHLPHVDLFTDEDIEQTMSPLEWLKAGRNPEKVVFLASRM